MNELSVPKQAEAASVTPNTMSLIAQAIERGAGIDVVERMVAMQREEREYQARVDFEGAMHRTQQKMKRISADAENPQTRSKYATYAKLDAALRPLYSAEGMSVSFNTADAAEGVVRVLAYVSRDGFTRTYQIDMPADGKGAKGNDVMTKTHATGAATQYGMRYLLKMIFNVAIGENDDDGNGASGQRMHHEEIDRYEGLISGSPSLEQLATVWRAAHKDAGDLGDANAQRFFLAKKDARKKELGG